MVVSLFTTNLKTFIMNMPYLLTSHVLELHNKMVSWKGKSIGLEEFARIIIR